MPTHIRRVRSTPVGSTEESAEQRHVRRTRAATTQSTQAVRTRYEPRIDTLSWGQLLQLYLMTSYLYYEMNCSIITDHAYDSVCQRLLAGWRTGVHPHKHLVRRSDLIAGSAYSLTWRYPEIVKAAASVMRDRHIEL